MGKKILDFLRQLLPHLIAVILFFVVTVIYFSPAFEGKVMRQMDFQHAQALQRETVKLYKETGHYSPWTTSVFSGMPNYHNYLRGDNNLIKKIQWILFPLPYSTARIFFLYLIGFYILLLSLRLNKVLSFLVSLAFALSSYNIIIIAVGHITKAYAIGYMPLVLASFIFIYDYKKYFWGALALAIFLSLQISTAHIQIVYYTALTVGSYIIYRLIVDIKNKQLKHFILASAMALFGTILAALPNTTKLWTSYELGKYSIRGGPSELVQEKNKKKQKGLDKEYALAWSYGIGESLTFIVPDVKGGESDYIGNDQRLMQKITSPFKVYLAQQSRYWGPQPFTSGPVYFGVILMFLFILGLFIVKHHIKWWLLAITILSIMLSWGKHFELLTDLFYYYFPMYSKFRVVSMILVVASLAIPVLAALTLKEIVNNPKVIKENLRGFIISFVLTGGIALLLIAYPKLAGSLLSPQEQQYLENLLAQNPANASQIQQFFNDLQSVRAMIVRASAWRSFIFVTLAALIILYFAYFVKDYKSKWQLAIFYSALGLLIIIDLWTLDRRFLNYNHFKPKRFLVSEFAPTLADKIINKTNELGFRVLNISRDPFNDALTSYYHRHIGGYSAAKLRRYQDIINYYLAPYYYTLIQALRDTTGTVRIVDVLRPMQVLHMLNTLYIIADPNSMPIVNPYAFGPAWFVDSYKFVKTAREEIEALRQVDLRRVAVINKTKFSDINFPELSLNPDSSRFITLTYFQPDSLVYHSYSNKTEFAVFSEIYYPKGWLAYIDGKQVPIVNVDYILRGLIVPPGEHQIIMVFKPKSYYLGRKISLIGSIILIIMFLGGVAYLIYKQFSNQKDKIKNKK